MVPQQEVLRFSKEICYDLETVDGLIDFERIKETLPIVCKILLKVDSFCVSLKKDTDTPQDLFPPSFWSKRSDTGKTFQELRLELEAMVREDREVSDKGLEALGYLSFVEELKKWIKNNAFKLTELTRSPGEKLFEKIFLGAAYILIIACALFFLLFGHLSKDYGLKAQYYDGDHFQKLIGTGVNKTIDFNSVADMSLLLPREHCSVKWQGEIIVPRTGLYTFSVLVDDGAYLLIDKDLLIDEWKYNDSKTYDKAVFLTAGTHHIRLYYFNGAGNAILKLYWQLQGGFKEIIPLWNLKQD